MWAAETSPRRLSLRTRGFVPRGMSIHSKAFACAWLNDGSPLISSSTSQIQRLLIFLALGKTQLLHSYSGRSNPPSIPDVYVSAHALSLHFNDSPGARDSTDISCLSSDSGAPGRHPERHCAIAFACKQIGELVFFILDPRRILTFTQRIMRPVYANLWEPYSKGSLEPHRVEV